MISLQLIIESVYWWDLSPLIGKILGMVHSMIGTTRSAAFTTEDILASVPCLGLLQKYTISLLAHAYTHTF